MDKIFKPTLDIRKKLDSIISSYQEAVLRDKKRIEETYTKTISYIKETLQCDFVAITSGAFSDEQFSIMVTKDQASVEITFCDFMNFYSAEVRTSQQEQLLSSLSLRGILDVGTSANMLIEEEFKTNKAESPKLTTQYVEAQRRMKIIQQRQQATLKWFLIPALLKEEDIIRFLLSLNPDQLIRVANDMCVDPTLKDLEKNIIGALSI